MLIDGVKNEYVNTPQGQGVQAKGADFTNSVMDKAATNNAAENTSVEENKNTSKLDELLEKLCAELSKYGLNAEEIKNSGILYRITGLNEVQIQYLSENELKQILECLKAAIKDTVKDGKIDLEKVGKTANDYYVALKTGWDSIEKFKRNRNGENLSQRMERFFGLQEGSFVKLPQAKIEEYLDRYFNNFFVDKLKNAKTETEKKQIYKQQLQDFGKLLINTPDEDKAIFKQAISSLVASNRIKGLDAVLASFDTAEARTAWADSWTVEDTKRLTTKADVEGNVISQEEATEGVAKLTAVKSEDGIKTHHEELQKDAKAFFEDNKDALARIAEKEANGEELTEEEKVLKLERDNFYTAVAAGEISGTAINEIIEEAVKEEILKDMNKDAYELPNYKEVIKQVTEFVEKHPEALTMPKEEIVKLLDEATNGNYSTVASGKDCELKAPGETNEETANVTDYGFSQSTEAPDTTRLQELKQQFTIENNETFTVETESTNKTEKLTTSEIYALKNNAFRSASNITTYLKETGETKFAFAAEVFKNFSDMGSTTQDWAIGYFSNASTAVKNLFLNKISNSVSGMVAAAKEVDLNKFNLIGVSVTTQKQIDKIQEQKA